MRTKRLFRLFSLTLALTLLGAYPGLTGVERKPETRGPVISHAFAVERGYYGYIWKIYLEAEDPNGQMLRIASVVNEVGWNSDDSWFMIFRSWR